MLIRSLIFLLTAQLFTYILVRYLIWQCAVRNPRLRKWLYIGCYTFGNGLLALTLLRVHSALFRFSAAWLVSLLFVFFVAAAVWLLQILLRRFRLPERTVNRLLRSTAPLALVSLFAAAVYNAYTPTVRHVHIRIDKPLAQPLRIGLASDLHLGSLFGRRQIDDLAAIMQREHVDMVFLPGDIMDDNTIAYQAEHMESSLKNLRAPLGVYATIGNHDIGYGTQPQNHIITQALEQAGVTVLTNRAVHVGNRFWVMGLPDKMLGKGRGSAADLLTQTDPAQPVFLLDHRPDDIPQHRTLPIDLQVSGHTHNGQVFPANLIVRLLFHYPYGHTAHANRHFVVTSGYGFWGIPFRLGSRSEVWIIDVTSR